MSPAALIESSMKIADGDSEDVKARKKDLASHCLTFAEQIGKLPQDDSFIVQEQRDQRVTVERPLNKNSVVDYIKACVQQIDHDISQRLDVILHNQDFQTLEASWRGLRNLVFNTETGVLLKLRLLNVTKEELRKDLEKATEFDQSALFKKIYEEEYGTFGGNPFSVLVGDYEFGRSGQDISLLDGLSHVAAAAHAPFLAGAAHELFGLESFTDLGSPRDLAKIFESSELIKWRSFRESDDSR
ncbi:MAG TPA: type VI secretion system contractile sheath large subunit, partial [Candidatus Saccharimonadales bacterium]|nr:type VI secretion system contractile sheath large subunit [Candidatus Saccharimonadales bacterium]